LEELLLGVRYAELARHWQAPTSYMHNRPSTRRMALSSLQETDGTQIKIQIDNERWATREQKNKCING
jgi:hypothetical protein